MICMHHSGDEADRQTGRQAGRQVGGQVGRTDRHKSSCHTCFTVSYSSMYKELAARMPLHQVADEWNGHNDSYNIMSYKSHTKPHK